MKSDKTFFVIFDDLIFMIVGDILPELASEI